MIDLLDTNIPLRNETERSRFTANWWRKNQQSSVTVESKLQNQLHPPSSEAPWENALRYEDEEEDAQSLDDIEALDKAMHVDKQTLGNDCHAEVIDTPSPSEASLEAAAAPAPATIEEVQPVTYHDATKLA